MTATITNFILSIGSLVEAALFIYSGKRIVYIKVFSSPDLGIIAFIGKDTVLRLKLPLIIFLPISFIICFPTALDKFTYALSRLVVPPFSCALGTLNSSLLFINANSVAYFKIAF